ncbi:hypothetical protein LTR37_004185 [Vermiconidia calcicola]|uniref:Uncharacterized protein n=1 Tax=Vermiconidia calcicola TaxID=1690605 RepID=A0ACC3NQH0_9PEZI|nr:hypothetical protein LTR37_004185 [Vermiconidia calcicola]
MSKTASSVFIEESEEESINTTTTAESEHDSEQEYPVERILAEARDVDGQMKYLLKWEGYPLYAAQWENTDNITHDVLLREWEADKRRASQGGKPLFDVTVWDAAFEQHEEEVQKKRRLRMAKRRRRGEEVSHLSHGSEDEGQLPTTEAPKRTRAKISPVRRKGVAQPVSKPRSRQSTAIDYDAEESSPDDDSLFDESEAPAPAVASPGKRKRIDAPTASAPRRDLPLRKTSSVPSATLNHKPASTAGKATTSVKSVEKAAASSVAKLPSFSSAARKSAPSGGGAAIGTAKRSNVFAGDWTGPKKKRERARVSGQTPKDSDDPKFSKLSIQNRYQKYSKNEPAPDISALAMVDPKTGKVQPPRSVPFKAPTNIHRAYGRRTPPPAAKRRSPTPPPPALQQGEAQAVPPNQFTLATEPSHSAGAAASGNRPVHDGRKSLTCKYWLSGTCQYTSERCPFAHSNQGVTEQKLITCRFWANGGRCNKTEEQCEFAHRFTGVVAGRPGTFAQSHSHQTDSEQKPKNPEQKLKTCHFWADGGRCNRTEEQCEFAHWFTGVVAEPPGTFRKVSRPTDPPVPVVAPDQGSTGQVLPIQQQVEPRMNEVPLPKPPLSNSLTISEPFEVAEKPHQPTAAADEPSDPRLRGRAPVATGSAVLSPTELVQHTPATVRQPELAESSVEGDIEMMSDDVEADLQMAIRGAPQLDLNRLLTVKAGKVTERVFLQIPEGRSKEMVLLKKRFERFHCKVFTSREPGHWDFFRKNFGKCCLVVLHPSELFAGTIPDLHNFLIEFGGGISVYSVGVQHEQCIREQRAPAYEAQRLFPQGQFTFISDDVFVYYPEKATEIIERFLESTAHKKPGEENSKIGARPGVKEWLLHFAGNEFDKEGGEDESKDLRWIKCYDALCRLCPVQDEDPYYMPERSVPLPSSHLWSIDTESLPSFKGRWESGDEEGATEYMANHFAGEACIQAWKWRRFVFVYQRPGDQRVAMSSQGREEVQQVVDPKGWMKKYNHIGVVTPEQALNMMKR